MRSQVGIDPCDVGGFETPFNHKNDNPFVFNGQLVFQWSAADWQAMGQVFHALHLALIPVGPFRGRLLAWSYNIPHHGSGLPSGEIFWSIIDPTLAPTDPNREMNFKRLIQPTGGNANDIACAGHTWLPDGRLVVYGGTERYGIPPNGVIGAKLTLVFDPNVDPLAGVPVSRPGELMWSQLPFMQRKRWYPTATLGAESQANTNPWVPALGGHIDDTQVPLVQDNYELWRPAGGWNNVNYSGPSIALPGVASALWAYPRTHLLSNQDVFVAGMFQGPPFRASSLPMPYVAAAWAAKGVTTQYREYGTSVLFPNVDDRHTDAVMILGGGDLSGVTASVAICKGTATAPGSFDATPQGYDWKTTLPSMLHARWYLNAVILPDTAVLAVGGQSSAVANYVLQAERYFGGAWQPMASMQTNRGYHSTAILLPSGKVLVAGGEQRLFDYEVYAPTYAHGCLPRPQWAPGYPSASLAYGQSSVAKVSVPTGATVAKVVLMRPGSVTHHFDQDQRYVQLETEAGSEEVTFTTPTNRQLAPAGHYMAFAVSNLGVPSTAAWVTLQ